MSRVSQRTSVNIGCESIAIRGVITSDRNTHCCLGAEMALSTNWSITYSAYGGAGLRFA